MVLSFLYCKVFIIIYNSDIYVCRTKRPKSSSNGSPTGDTTGQPTGANIGQPTGYSDDQPTTYPTGQPNYWHGDGGGFQDITSSASSKVFCLPLAILTTLFVPLVLMKWFAVEKTDETKAKDQGEEKGWAFSLQDEDSVGNTEEQNEADCQTSSSTMWG